jgi:hypothetical protein
MKVKSFVKQFISTVKGDEVGVQAEKCFRAASSALNTQISSLGGDTIQLEDKVTDAKEAHTSARINNGQSITNRNTYVENLLTSKNNVTIAEKNLKSHIEKIDFLKAELKALETEVEA